MPVVRDIMCQPAIAVPSDATVAEAVRRIAEQHVSSMPVVSAQGAVVGIISEMALLDILFEHAMRDAPVSEFMEPHVHTVHPDASLTQAAHMLALYEIRRLPVVENGVIVGVIARKELLVYALEAVEPLTEPLVELIPSLGQYT